ncbi:2594_t:CDS:2, partial [Paraglomus brasilianum]
MYDKRYEPSPSELRSEEAKLMQFEESVEKTNLSSDVVDKLEGGTHNQDVLEDETVDLNKRMIKPLESEKFEVATNDVFPDSTKTHRAIVPIACPKMQCHKELDDNDPGINIIIYIATDDKAPLGSHLISMLDTMVAAHAETFY